MSIESNPFDKYHYTIGGKEVVVYPSLESDKPVLYLHTFAEEGDRVYAALRSGNCPDFTLVVISGLNWDHDMAPWDIPAISPGDTPCTGGADEYLRLLVEEIMPKAERLIKGRVLWRGIAGYSLAGLFAVYAMYQTGIFTRVSSISGSLWFPNFAEYVFAQEMKQQPEHLYFSLGDRECRTGNPYLKVVQEQTEKVACFYKNKGINTIFHLNSGGHFKNAVARTAAGIMWLLEQ